MSRSIFVDRLCCSRALDNPTLQLPEKQVDTEEHYDNYNNYSKTKRNGDDHQDDYNKRDGELIPRSPTSIHDKVRSGNEIRIFPYRPGDGSKD